MSYIGDFFELFEKHKSYAIQSFMKVIKTMLKHSAKNFFTVEYYYQLITNKEVFFEFLEKYRTRVKPVARLLYLLEIPHKDFINLLFLLARNKNIDKITYNLCLQILKAKNLKEELSEKKEDTFYSRHLKKLQKKYEIDIIKRILFVYRCKKRNQEAFKKLQDKRPDTAWLSPFDSKKNEIWRYPFKKRCYPQADEIIPYILSILETKIRRKELSEQKLNRILRLAYNIKLAYEKNKRKKIVYQRWGPRSIKILKLQ